MTTMEPLGDEEIRQGLQALDGWTLDAGKLHRTFTFANFVEAFGFMTRAALLAEKQDHHPEWSNVYKTVRVHLTTHEAGGLTHRDFDLARAMDALAS